MSRTMHKRSSFDKLPPPPGRMLIKSTEEVQQQRTKITLEMLPLEIILHICDFLPPWSKATLTITSKRLYSGLGSKNLALLKTYSMREEKRSLLMLLKKDLKDRYLCWRCDQFHPITTCPAVDLGHSECSESQCVQEDGILELPLSRRIQFRHAHALMTHFRHRWPYEDQLISLTFQYEEPVWDCFKKDRVHTARLTTSVLPEIRHDALFLRVSAVLYMADCCELEEFRPRLPEICPHFHPTFFPYFGKEDPIQIISRHIALAEKSKRSSRNHPRRMSCSWCETEFYVGASISKGSMLKRQRIIQVNFEIEKNLGQCVNPSDIIWITHCSQLETPRERLKKLNPAVFTKQFQMQQ